MVLKTSSGTSLPVAHGFTSFASSSVRRISVIGFLRLSCFMVFALHKRFFMPPKCTRILRVVFRLFSGFLSFSFDAGGARCTLDFLVCFLGGARTRLFFLAPPICPGAVEGAGEGEGRDVPALPALGRGTRAGAGPDPEGVGDGEATRLEEGGAGPEVPEEGAAPAPPDWNAPPMFLRNDPIFEIFIAAIAMAGPGAVSNPPVCGALAFLVVLVLFE